MKILFRYAVAAALLCGSFVASAANADDPQDVTVSVLKPASVAVQDQDPPVPAQAQDAATQPSVSDQVPEIAPVAEVAPVVVTAAYPVAPVYQVAPACGCGQPAPICCCKPAPVCCKPKPVPTEFCLVDPCGCSHAATICLPAECVGQAPCVKWRGGVTGRQVATLCWECCGHKVKVVIRRNGKVKVRG